MPRRSTRRVRRGNYALEFALCFPLWFAMISAMLDFGWLMFHRSTLDAGAGEACRQGALLDPGEADQNIAAVESAASARLVSYLAPLTPDHCADCTVTAYTLGAPYERTLVCEASRPFTPLLGVFVHITSLTATDARWLEWQRQDASEAAPT